VNDNGPDVTTYTHYGIYGMIDYSKDGRGTIPSSIASWDSQHLFPTQIATPIGSESFTYDPDTGHLLSHTDLNGGVTTNNYDGAGRLQSTKNPDAAGGYTTYTCYPDANTFVQYQAQSMALSNPSSCGAALGDAIVSKTILDGLDRVTDVIKGSGIFAIEQSTQYDLLDRPNKQSNPYMASGGAEVWTISHYDALGRIYQIDYPDGSTSLNKFTGLTTVSTDEAGNKKETVSDALGRTVQVLQPSALTGNLTLSTTYLYNVHGLTDVLQNGETNEAVRQRHFTYNSLNQLVTSQNPEAGTVCYGVWNGDGKCINGYDGNGNLWAKTDARGITTNYSYDLLNHLLSKTYTGDPNNTTPSCYQYGSSATGKTIGRLINEWTQSVSDLTQSGTCPTSPPANPKSLHTVLAYDPMGRITQEQRCTGIHCTQQVYRPMVYSYDLAGHLIGSGDGLSGASALSFVTQYDQIGRLLNVSGGVPGGAIPLFSVQSYGPVGWTGATIGSQLSAQRIYDNRTRLTGETVVLP
jgi:YD repeat-containing protein